MDERKSERKKNLQMEVYEQVRETELSNKKKKQKRKTTTTNEMRILFHGNIMQISDYLWNFVRYFSTPCLI